MTKLVFKPPSAEDPGYLRRAKKSLEFREKINQKIAGPAVIDELVDFLLVYVQEPKDRNEAREALFDATETQFLQLIDVVMGNTNDEENPTPAQPTNDPSSTGPAE